MAVPSSWIKVDLGSPDADLRRAGVGKTDLKAWRESTIRPLAKDNALLTVDTAAIAASKGDFLTNAYAMCEDAADVKDLQELERAWLKDLKDNPRTKNVSAKHVTLNGMAMVRVTYARASGRQGMMFWLLSGGDGCSLTMTTDRMDGYRATFEKMAGTIRIGG